MNAVKTYSKKIYLSDYFPLYILFMLIFILHISIKSISGDDLFFSKVLEEQTLNDFLIFRFNNWTSRLIIEGFMVLLLQLNFIFWQIIDSLMYVLLAYAISKIFINENKRKMNYIIVMLIIMYPIRDMETAGWIATTMNYLWPLSLGLFSLISIKKIVIGDKINRLEYIAYFISLIYATSSEQAVIWLTPTYILALLFTYFYNKKFSILLFINSLVCAANLLVFLFCPGNESRIIQETQHWMVDFPTLSRIDKVYLGISETIYYFTSNVNSIYILFSIIIFTYVFKKYKNIVFRVISFIPFIVLLCTNIIADMFPILSKLTNGIYSNYIINILNYDNPYMYIPFFIFILLIGVIIINLYLIFDNNYIALLCIIILGLGLLTRIIMGFSPTLYASSTRTYIYLYFAFIIVSIILLTRNKNYMIDKLLLGFTVLSYFNNFMFVIM